MVPKMQETSEVFVSAAAECNVYAGVGGMNANHMPVAAVTKCCRCLCLEVEVEEGARGVGDGVDGGATENANAR